MPGKGEPEGGCMLPTSSSFLGSAPPPASSSASSTPSPGGQLVEQPQQQMSSGTNDRVGAPPFQGLASSLGEGGVGPGGGGPNQLGGGGGVSLGDALYLYDHPAAPSTMRQPQQQPHHSTTLIGPRGGTFGAPSPSSSSAAATASPGLLPALPPQQHITSSHPSALDGSFSSLLQPQHHSHPPAPPPPLPPSVRPPFYPGGGGDHHQQQQPYIGGGLGGGGAEGSLGPIPFLLPGESNHSNNHLDRSQQPPPPLQHGASLLSFRQPTITPYGTKSAPSSSAHSSSSNNNTDVLSRSTLPTTSSETARPSVFDYNSSGSGSSPHLQPASSYKRKARSLLSLDGDDDAASACSLGEGGGGSEDQQSEGGGGEKKRQVALPPQEQQQQKGGDGETLALAGILRLVAGAAGAQTSSSSSSTTPITTAATTPTSTTAPLTLPPSSSSTTLALPSAALATQQQQQQPGLPIPATVTGGGGAAIGAPPVVQVVPRLALSDDNFLQLTKQAVMGAYVDLAQRGAASRGRTLGILAVWDTYNRLMGADCTHGLRADLTRAMEVEHVNSGLDSLGDAGRGRGARMLHKLTDETACYLWATVVDSQQVYFCANARFSELFFSGDELRARLWEWRMLSGLIWGKVVLSEDLRKFYAAFVEILFSTEDSSPNHVVVRCRSRTGKVIPCLVSMAFHGERSPGTGAPTRTYCARLWPLISRELSLSEPITRHIVSLV